MSETLKPCPFCGSNPFVCKLVAGVHLGCNNEECPVSRLYTLQYPTEIEAIKAWNIRKDPYTVDCTHTDKGEQKAALALAVKQLARTEGKLIACEKALKVYRDRDKQLEDILGKPQQFFPQCIHREMKGNVAMCYDPENARHNKPCSKRCETPTKGESK